MTGSCYPCGLWPSTDERDKGSNSPKRAGHRRRASFAEAGILMYHACGTPRDEIVMDPARVEANRWEPAERANRAHRDAPALVLCLLSGRLSSIGGVRPVRLGSRAAAG
jgi:hypothetical protein